MKKIPFLLFVAAILIAVFTAITTSKTNAAHPVDGHCPRPNCNALTSTDRNVAAVLYHNETCLLPDASGSYELESLWPMANCTQCVATNSNSNAELCVFKGHLPEGAQLPHKTINITFQNSSPLMCQLENAGPRTNQYQFTIKPNGQVSGYCLFTGK